MLLVGSHLLHLDFHFQYQILGNFLHVLNPVGRESGVGQIYVTNTLTWLTHWCRYVSRLPFLIWLKIMKENHVSNNKHLQPPACFKRTWPTIHAKAGLRAGRSSSRTGSIVSYFTSLVSLCLGQRVFKDSSYQAIIKQHSSTDVHSQEVFELRCLFIMSTTSGLIWTLGAVEKHNRWRTFWQTHMIRLWLC